MSAVVLAAAAAAVFRIVPLACASDRLAISGGGVLALAAGTACAAFVPGKAAGITLDAGGRASPAALGPAARPASELPRTAFVLAPAADGAEAGPRVTATIEVDVPPRTPSDASIYLSTERTGWNPAEIRMDQVDARRFRLRLELPAGATVPFRVTRGSFATTERDAEGRLPPAHVLKVAAGAVARVTVIGWADDQ